jgi:hypothetical protein
MKCPATRTAGLHRPSRPTRRDQPKIIGWRCATAPQHHRNVEGGGR